MSEKFILALDQGTTSSRAILFNHQGKIVAQAQKEFKQFYPQPGWVEHDAEEIWSSQFGVMAEAMARQNIRTESIAAIGITNQRETTVVWDRNTHQPICPAIVWQDRRTAAYCDEVRNAGHAARIKEKTGLILDAYFSATKLKWILDHVPGAREKAANGSLAFGTVDSWLTWKLSNGEIHITDASNASRTMLMNIHTGDWDPELLDLFDIPASVLPQIKNSSEVYGHTKVISKEAGIPIAGIAGDQQAALFGQLCTEPGMVKNTYGTGCFMLMQTGTQPIQSHNQLLTTIAWRINNKQYYALEGSVFIAGAVVQWLRDGLKIIRHSQDVEALAATVNDSEGVYIVPAFAGLGAPYWNAYARGTIFGLTRGSSEGHIARAALESIAYQTTDVLKAMEADSGIPIKELRVDGGATVNNLLMQFQSDVLQTPVVRPVVYETTALGAAYLAGLAVGYWEDIDSLQQQWAKDASFTPALSQDVVTDKLKGWKRAIKATIAWSDEH